MGSHREEAADRGTLKNGLSGLFGLSRMFA
jgi:hypothetical protein